MNGVDNTQAEKPIEVLLLEAIGCTCRYGLASWDPCKERWLYKLKVGTSYYATKDKSRIVAKDEDVWVAIPTLRVVLKILNSELLRCPRCGGNLP